MNKQRMLDEARAFCLAQRITEASKRFAINGSLSDAQSIASATHEIRQIDNVPSWVISDLADELIEVSLGNGDKRARTAIASIAYACKELAEELKKYETMKGSM